MSEKQICPTCHQKTWWSPLDEMNRMMQQRYFDNCRDGIDSGECADCWDNNETLNPRPHFFKWVKQESLKPNPNYSMENYEKFKKGNR